MWSFFPCKPEQGLSNFILHCWSLLVRDPRRSHSQTSFIGNTLYSHHVKLFIRQWSAELTAPEPGERVTVPQCKSKLQRKEITCVCPSQVKKGWEELPELCPGPRAHSRKLGRARHGNLRPPSPQSGLCGLPTLGHTLSRWCTFSCCPSSLQGPQNNWQGSTALQSHSNRALWPHFHSQAETNLP